MQYLYKNRVAKLVLALGIMGFVFLIRTPHAAAAACATPGTDYGTVTFDNTTTTNHFSAPAANVAYRVWTRMAVPDATNVNFLLEVEGTTDSGGKTCFTVGSSNITPSPDLATTTTTPTVNWSWINYSGSSTSSTNTVTFATAGAHTIRLIGNAPNVAVDRLIFTQDTTGSNCNPPIGTGEACATPADTTGPTVSVSNPGTVTATTTLTATATDDTGGSGVKQVQFFLDSSTTALTGTVTNSGSTYSLSWTPTSAQNGTHTIKAVATDNSNNSTTSNSVSFTVNITVVIKPGDTNNDNKVDITDLTNLAVNYRQSGKTRAQGDFTGEGTVDFSDLTILVSHWGT